MINLNYKQRALQIYNKEFSSDIRSISKLFEGEGMKCKITDIIKSNKTTEEIGGFDQLFKRVYECKYCKKTTTISEAVIFYLDNNEMNLERYLFGNIHNFPNHIFYTGHKEILREMNE